MDEGRMLYGPVHSTIATLCDKVIDVLDSPAYGSRYNVASRKPLCSEVGDLKKFSGLVDRVRRARVPQSTTTVEGRHWQALDTLSYRCRQTLSSLHQRLLVADFEDLGFHCNEPWIIHHDGDQLPDVVSLLQGEISCHKQTLQLSLRAFNL